VWALSGDDSEPASTNADDAGTVDAPASGDGSEATTGGVEVELAPVGDATADQLDQQVSIIRKCVDALGLDAADISRQGDAIVVRLPQAESYDRALEPTGQTADLRFRPVLASSVVPVEAGDVEMTPTDQDDPEAQVTLVGRTGDGPADGTTSVFQLGPAVATGRIVTTVSPSSVGR
jgi:preprotein translocase subunit SecD